MGLLDRLRRRGGDPMRCQELVEEVTAYLEGALPPAEQQRLEEHLAQCEACGMYLDQMRDTLRLLGRITVDDVSPQAERELRAAFRAWRESG